MKVIKEESFIPERSAKAFKAGVGSRSLGNFCQAPLTGRQREGARDGTVKSMEMSEIMG